MPTYVMPSCCAAAATGPTGKPTTPNMNRTPCFFRFLAINVAPSTSAMSSLLSACSRVYDGAPLPFPNRHKIAPPGARVKPRLRPRNRRVRSRDQTAQDARSAESDRAISREGVGRAHGGLADGLGEGIGERVQGAP